MNVTGTDATSNSQTNLRLVVSGGQTGVDRAALDAALEANLPVGGWCPRGRRSEDGMIPDRYPLTETPARSYAVRTEWNVRDSDGTLILVLNEISSGTALTRASARKQGKPCEIVFLRSETQGSLFNDHESLPDTISRVTEWIVRNQIETLNVAGPRNDADGIVYSEAFRFLQALFRSIIASEKSEFPEAVTKAS